MELEVFDKSGSQTGKKVSLPDSVFGIEPNDHAIYLDVKQFLANQRQGTHKSKERAEIVGSTKKLKKQKGTGTARAGSIKSPVFRGGGRVFGPKPRDYSFKLNKKLKKLARKSALSYKASGSSIAILEDFTLDAPKTKEYASILKSLNFEGKKVLLVLPEADKSIILSVRNLPKSKVTTVDSLNTYDIMNADQLLVFENSIEKFSNF
ncbi:50S ribosomal protein L4 [Chondrinema litorale]|uniref:50S ribosomal protein L4 n=1 Tax=Chondrinema litorale TaxID=2994555 RepID=UPI002544A5ED|nr:50S ribosomal protein L4 [Chondrinema litorale]UZR92770.1 50S ribosomal protein L4 [Chondrinema litorale]